MQELDVYAPSNAILQALGDLEKVEKLDNYRVDMDDWCKLEWSGSPNKLEKSEADVICSVCFAGSVMTQRLTNGANFDIDPESFSKPIKNTLEALDLLRQYFYEDFLDSFYGDSQEYVATKATLLTALEKLNIEVWDAEYKSDPKQFKKNMRKIAKTLQEYGC